MIRVLLADDEAMVRAGITAILAHDPEIEVVAEVGDGAAAVEAARRHRPEVALLDIRMPELDGLAATGRLRAAVPGTAVIILTTFHDDSYIAEALGAGASGFLVKFGDPRELIAAVRAVAGGASYLSPEVAHRVIAQLGPDRLARAAAAREQVARLTGREREVLALLAEGLPNAEIAQRLYLVEGTVKAYVSAILTGLAHATGSRRRSPRTRQACDRESPSWTELLGGSVDESQQRGAFAVRRHIDRAVMRADHDVADPPAFVGQQRLRLRELVTVDREPRQILPGQPAEEQVTCHCGNSSPS